MNPWILTAGYKLREKIGKALKARAEAIKNALSEYNRRAVELNPPRRTLNWEDILEMASLSDFDILRDTRADIRKFHWTQQPYRRAMNLWFNMKRAREEIERLNVEIPRLFTFMIDQHYDYQRAIQSADAPLAYELRQRWAYDDRIHARICARLYQTSALPGFSGKVVAGRRVGREVFETNTFPLPAWAHCLPSGVSPASGGAEHGGVDFADGIDNDAGGQDGANSTVIAGIDDEQDVERFVDFVDDLSGDSNVRL